MVLGLFDQLLIFSVVSDRTARTFNRSGATGGVALDISKGFDRVWHPSLQSKPRFNWEKARFNQDEYNFNSITQDLTEILS